jgi:GNAT superfamily N-acetyltransferase
MIGIREASAADRDAILALRKRCFPNEDLHKQDPAYWDAEFADGRMFVAEAGERVVAHLGFIPRCYDAGVGALAVDAMTDPDFRRQGLFDRVAAFSVDALRKDFRFSTAWQIRKAVLPAMTKNGWEACAIAPVFVRPVLFSSRGGVPVIQTVRTTLKGFDTLALLDVPSRAFLNDAIRYARSLRVQLVAALLTLRHPAVPLVISKGFLPSPYRFRLLVNSFDKTLDPHRVKWALSWKDTDHF